MGSNYGQQQKEKNLIFQPQANWFVMMENLHTTYPFLLFPKFALKTMHKYKPLILNAIEAHIKLLG